MRIDTAEARLAVKLSRLAYQNADSARTGVEALGLGDFTFFDAASTQAFTATGNGRRYLAFRGTETDRPPDWIRDAQFSPMEGEFGTEVHSGFHNALNEIWDEVSAALAGTDPVVPTGHSLGAALATLAAARLQDSGRDVEGVYTFGQPRSGQGAFATEFNRRLENVTYRFINHIDLVTRVPLLVQGYRHVGRRMYFDESGTFHPDARSWTIAKDDLSYRLRNFGRIESTGLGSHEISRYDDLVSGL